ncbi:hypothetical protein NKH77_36190 [Streptomyces sp. M19]
MATVPVRRSFGPEDPLRGRFAISPSAKEAGALARLPGANRAAEPGRACWPGSTSPPRRLAVSHRHRHQVRYERTARW